MTTKILVVDDERPIIDLLTYNLQRAGYQVLAAWDGESALARARHEQPDLIILDLMLPKLDGIEVCRALRREQADVRTSDVPIIMLTARDEEIDRVLGLELGADDYVVKPFSVRELLARVKAVLRRTQQNPHDTEAMIRAGDLLVDRGRYEARLGGVPLDLTTLQQPPSDPQWAVGAAYACEAGDRRDWASPGRHGTTPRAEPRPLRLPKSDIARGARCRVRSMRYPSTRMGYNPLLADPPRHIIGVNRRSDVPLRR